MSALAADSARETSGRGNGGRRMRRRDAILPAGAVATLLLAFALYGAQETMAALVVSAAMCVSALIALAISGPRSAPWQAAAALAAIWVCGAASLWSGAGNAIPALAVLSAAVAAWTVGHLCGRTRAAMDMAWGGLVWSALAYSMWTFVGYVAAIMNSASDVSITAGFSSTVASAVIFGALTIVGCGKVTHVIKRIDAEGLARSEVLDRLLRDGLGGLLLAGFALTCLALSGSTVGLLLCIGVCIGHVWLDTRSILTRDHRSLWVRIAERSAPVAALVFISGAIALGWMFDETVDAAAAGLGESPRLQRLAAYLDAWRASPVFGHGLGSIETVRDKSMTLANAIALQAPDDAQNVVVRWLVETGLAGLALTAVLLAAPATVVIRSLGNRRNPRTFARLSLALAVFLLAHGVLDSTLDIPAVFLLLAFVTGLSTGIARTAEKRTN